MAPQKTQAGKKAVVRNEQNERDLAHKQLYTHSLESVEYTLNHLSYLTFP